MSKVQILEEGVLRYTLDKNKFYERCNLFIRRIQINCAIIFASLCRISLKSHFFLCLLGSSFEEKLLDDIRKVLMKFHIL